MDLDTVFQKAKKEFVKSPNNSFITALHALEDFMVDDEWNDVEDLKDPEVKKEYLNRQNHSEQAIAVFDKITKIINPTQPPALTTRKIYKKYDHFTERVSFARSGSIYSSRPESSITVDHYIPDEYRLLKRLESVAVKNKIAISEYLVTAYHQSGLSIPQYMTENGLFNELNEKSNASHDNRNINMAVESMRNYLIEYERAVAKPLPYDVNQRININRFSDDITIIMQYMIEINNGIHNILSNRTSYPVQLDVFFVSPEADTDVNLHSLSGLEGCIKSDADTRKNGAVDGISDVYKLLRRAAVYINKEFGQRFVILIVRANKDSSSEDTIYIYKPTQNNSVPDGDVISDSVELTYLLNSKSQIVPGLSSNQEGILGFTHHLHSVDCNKVYLSYGDYKSRVFKHDVLKKLQILFNWNNANRHFIGDNTRIEFKGSYTEFRDDKYHQYGEYWFNNAKSYECYEPYWNPQNCRAMGNVFIPKERPSCTEQLKEYIDEPFESAEKLYYKMDYTVGLQIVDEQTIYIKSPGMAEGICLINTELHKNGKPLYAVIVRNTHRSKQRWKIIKYSDISEAFMTKEQLMEQYGIFGIDLPEGSIAKHNNYNELKAQIVVNKELIRNTNWSHIRIVQSKQNLGKLGITAHKDTHQKPHKCNGKSNGNNNKEKKTENIGVLEISEKKFKKLAIKSWIKHQEEGKPLIPIAHFKFRKNKYHLEKLLPVYIPDHGKYVAISFWYNQMTEKGRTQASGVCLDLTDMKNKANLIAMVPKDAWLNEANEAMTVNNLNIGNRDTPPTKPKKSSKSKSSKSGHGKSSKNSKNKKKSSMSAAKSLPIKSTKTASSMSYVSCKVPTSFAAKQQQQQQHIQSMQQMPTRTYNVQTTYNVQAPNTMNNMNMSPNMQALQPQLLPQATFPCVSNIQQTLQSHLQYAQCLPNPANFNVMTQQTMFYPQYAYVQSNNPSVYNPYYNQM